MRPPTANRRPARARRSAIVAVCLLVAGLGAAHALAAGGLSVTPGILEHVAQPGAVGPLTVSNTTSRPMRVSVAARPWLQSRSGSVVPNRRKVLGKVHAGRRSFRLAPGGTRTVGLSLARGPRGGSLYGAIEVTGTPNARRRGNGVRVAYRLVTSLRLYPPVGARRYHARPKRLFQHGTTGHGALFLAVKNGGNTIDPIGGLVRISGNHHTLSGAVASKAILPGSTVNLRLARLRGNLPRGRYRVGVRLLQAGQKVGGFRRGVRLR